MTPQTSQSLRIAIFGPGSSGKTTLARLLSNHYGCHMITESIRTTAAAMGLGNIATLSRETRFGLQCAAAQLQVQQETGRDFFVSDRSRLDYVFYTWKLLGAQEADMVTGIVRQNLKPYDMLFILPPPKEIEHDGFRFPSPIDSNMHQWLTSRPWLTNHEYAKWGHLVESDTPTARLAECVQVIKELCTP